MARRFIDEPLPPLTAVALAAAALAELRHGHRAVGVDALKRACAAEPLTSVRHLTRRRVTSFALDTPADFSGGRRAPINRRVMSVHD